jgi:hypothetical protein
LDFNIKKARHLAVAGLLAIQPKEELSATSQEQ